MEQRVEIYSMCMCMMLAQRYMRNLREIGAVHPAEKTIERAINVLAPAYRDELIAEIILDEYVEGCDVGPEGVKRAVKYAEAIIEAFGYAETPRRTTALCQ